MIGIGLSIKKRSYFTLCDARRRRYNMFYWLPDLDSNQDKLNQNQLCYHYTIGQIRRELKIVPLVKFSNQQQNNLQFASSMSVFCSADLIAWRPWRLGGSTKKINRQGRLCGVASQL